MRLRKIELENFRQFYGSQRLDFSEDETRNVTIIYGANGAGKTTLLNAFTWAFYNKVSADFENPEEIINKRAWAEADAGTELDARVAIEFEHEGNVYRVTRATTEKKNSDGSAVLIRDAVPTATRIDSGGHQSELGNPAELASQILPYRLSSFFFFNGERIENLVKPTAYAQIEDGIKTLLGLSIVERAIDHTDKAVRELRRAQQQVGSPETKSLTEALDAAEQKRDAKVIEEADLAEKLRIQNDLLQKIDRELRAQEAAKTIQRQRDEAERSLQETQDAIQEGRRRTTELIGQKGYLAFTGNLAERCLATVSDLHEKGELPAPLKKQFVDELLERGTCICDRDLREGETPYLAVCGWRARAGAGAEEAWGQLTAHAKHAKDERPTFYADLKERVQLLFSLGATEKKLNERLSELHKQLSDKDSATIKSLEDRRQRVKEDIDSLGLKRGGVRQEIKDLQEDIRQIEKQLKDAEEKGEQAQKAKRRVEIATAARDIFERILDLRTEEVRSGLDERVRRIFSDISFKASVPRLSGDFHLELLESIDGGRIVAKSTGENLLLSLSFVGALAEYARERFEESSHKSGDLVSGLNYRGGIYPLVTDSPFGDLDENYCSDIARAIPVLAPQVLVMISKRQAGGPVEGELGQRVGARYVLEFHSEKEQAAETINVLGHDYPYISQAVGTPEWAEIRTIG